MSKNNFFIKAITLVEMLVVITVVAVLAGFFIVRLSDSRYQAELSAAKAFSMSLVINMPADFLSEFKFDGPTAAGSAATSNDVKETWSAKNGTVNGAPTIRGGIDCISEKCIQVDGTDDYVSHPIISVRTSPSSTQYPVTHTFAVWTKWLGSSSPGAIYPFGASSNNNNTIYYKGNSDYQFGYRGQSPSNVTYITDSNTTVLFDGKWHFVVWTMNSSSQIKLFIDGKQNGSLTLVSNPEMDYEGIGRGYGNNNYNWNGLIDDLRIFTTTLSVSEIKERYFSGINKLMSQGFSKEEYIQRMVDLENNLAKQ